jgi:tetratricopeptide (TPR) repeat protein
MNFVVVLHRALATGLVPLLLAAGAPAAAQSIPGYPEHVTDYDPREVVMLPEYCKYTQLFRDRVPGGNNREMIQRWHATMGDIFMAMHHYCWGLMHLNRARILARDAQARSFNYGSAVAEFDYVLRQARPDFVLLPEILTKRGEALLGLGRAAQAMVEFERAIELRPDYWPPYAQIADYHQSQGDREKARAILQTGLKHAPGTNGLQRRLKELDEQPAQPPVGRGSR